MSYSRSIVAHFFSLAMLMFGWVSGVIWIFAEPAAAGSLIVDPAYPQWFKQDGGPSFFLCSPGDPEGFLYRGSRNSDGTRSGDQMTLINKLAANGGNGLYFQMIRSHGGDGDKTHNPFVHNDPAEGLNTAVLDQWETWFTAMDQAGILIYAIFFDDSANVWGRGDTVPSAERAFLQAIVARFKHHQHLMWVVAEEYGEAFTSSRVANMAAIIRAADNNRHPIGVHKNHGLTFSEFANNSNLDQFAIQYNNADAPELHRAMVDAFNTANGRYNLNMAESAGHGSGAAARLKNWAVALGGAYVMVLGWDIAGTATADLRDCKNLVGFMETTNFAQMTPRDDLAFGGTQYVLADPSSHSYILYASALNGQIGVRNIEAGTYDLHWLNITNGTVVDQSGVPVSGGSVTFTRPSGIGSEMAVWVRPL